MGLSNILSDLAISIDIMAKKSRKNNESNDSNAPSFNPGRYESSRSSMANQ